MKAIYTDLHIHTSEDADKLNKNYNVDLLVDKVKEFSRVATSDIMLSLTDHNVINKEAYTKLLSINGINVILGVELHIRNYDRCLPYHCHMFFDIDQNKILDNIDSINKVLNHLYPKKMVNKLDDIPKLEDISKSFDKYEYVMLPHGGQSHNTFDKSFPKDKDVKFDTALERNIYYNQFDGFTSRSNQKVEETENYFRKLGINSFINLITCTDNYNPRKYPESKSSEADEFVPTWINSKPTFQGLRLALSERTRLFYQNEQPKFSNDYIKHIVLKNDKIDIDVHLTPGLNVVIGGSSSGKTLFMDSIFHKLKNDFSNDNAYLKYGVQELSVDNPAGNLPHYINQNYIIKIIDENSDDGIENIDIIRETFLSDDEVDKLATQQLNQLHETIKELFNSINKIEQLQITIKSLKHFPRLISKSERRKNYFETWIPNESVQSSLLISEADINAISSAFEKIRTIAKNNPFIDEAEIEKNLNSIQKEFETAKKKKECSDDVLSIINDYKIKFDKEEEKSNSQSVKNNKEFLKLKKDISDYVTNINTFHFAVEKFKNFSFQYDTKPIISNGHKLSIENRFELNEEIILDAINSILPKANKVNSLEMLEPESLFKDKIDGRKKGTSYGNEVYEKIQKQNKKTYKIITKEQRDFKSLSPGWKTAVILDLILGYSSDNAPIFIDQPEDNLATSYINRDLVDAIKKCKKQKQVLIISHNATIPMLADAQNIVLCRNEDDKIVIRSGAMEEKIDGKNVIDYIAEITDGGKASVKKRVKKYNMRSFREEQ